MPCVAAASQCLIHVSLFLYHVLSCLQTNELTEDGTPYLLEVESHESGVLQRILHPAGPEVLSVGTAVGVFSDPDWSEGDPPRGDFLWQAYVKEGALRQGSCTPQRTEEEEQATGGQETTQTIDSKSKKSKAAEDKAAKPKVAAKKPRKQT